MKYKKRLLEPKLKQVGTHFPVVVLTGARQVRKKYVTRNITIR
jgi:hypothetical protein